MGLMSVGSSVGSGQYKNLIPVLTSVSQNGYKVSASSVNPAYPPENVIICFDGNTEDTAWGLGDDFRERIFINKSNTGQSITIELPQAKDVRMVVAIYPATARQGVGCAASIAVSGSNDGKQYTSLGGAAATSSVFMRSKEDTVKYRYYKIDMTRQYEYIGIIELMLLGK